MISAIELERYVAGAGIFGVVVGKFCHEKKPCLIILLKVDKGSKVGFHCIILPFGLTVCLWVEDGGESPLDAKEIA